MSLRTTAAAQSFERTANLPATNLYSACGWGQMLVDRNDFQTWFTLENVGFEGMGCDSDGTSFQFFSNSNIISVDTLVANRWFWWAVSRNGTAVRVLYIPQPGAAIQTFSATIANLDATSQFMNIMNDHLRDSFVNGCGAAFKIWDAVLTDAELAQEAYTLRPQRVANLNVWVPAIHSTAALASQDFSGNGRNFTVVSTPTVADGPPVSWGARPVFTDAPASAVVDATANITGVAGTGQAGTVTAKADSTALITGVSGTGQVGSVTAKADSTASITGVSASGQAGTLSPLVDSTALVTGVSGSGQAGTLAAAADSTAALTGVQASGQPGDLAVSATADVALVGVAGAGQVGDLSISAAADAPITGVGGTGEVTAPGVRADSTATITGTEALGAAGELSISVSDTTITLSGLQADGQVGVIQTQTDTAEGLDGAAWGGVEYTVDRTYRHNETTALRGVEARGGAGMLSVLVDQPQPEAVLPVPSVLTIPAVRLLPRQDAVVGLLGIEASMPAPASAGAAGIPIQMPDAELEQFALVVAGWR